MKPFIIKLLIERYLNSYDCILLLSTKVLPALAGDETSPMRVASASNNVRSFSEPRNLDESSKSLRIKRTFAPLTYSLKMSH